MSCGSAFLCNSDSFRKRKKMMQIGNIFTRTYHLNVIFLSVPLNDCYNFSESIFNFFKSDSFVNDIRVTMCAVHSCIEKYVIKIYHNNFWRKFKSFKT